MPGTPVKIGPWTGGLNTYSDPTTIADQEAAELTNFDIDLDGSIVNRPAVDVQSSPTSGGLRILCQFIKADGSVYYIGVDKNNNVKQYDPNTTGVVSIVNGVTTLCAVQYQSKIWIIATTGSAAASGSWDGTTYTSIAGMARGVTAAIYKERLFVGAGAGAANPNRVNFSNAANFSVFTTGSDFFDVSQGDGESIILLYSYQGSIIVFKTNSTFLFGYDTQPTRGQVNKLSGSIGITSNECLAEYENVLYVLHQNYLYSIQNWVWQQLNEKVVFKVQKRSARVAYSETAVSVMGIRIIVHFFDNVYVYGIKTRAFTFWDFSTADFYISAIYQHPYVDSVSNRPIFYAGAYSTTDLRWYRIIDTPSGSLIETFTCKLTTKTYDYNVPYSFKHLQYWGTDILSKTSVIFEVDPTAYNTPVTWGQLKAFTWSQLGTWARPINIIINVSDSVSTPNPSSTRVFVKLLKSLRFRQVAFKISTTVNGTPAQGPLRVFSITAFTSSKQKTSRKIS